VQEPFGASGVGGLQLRCAGVEHVCERRGLGGFLLSRACMSASCVAAASAARSAAVARC
jgi:hypothetical protein